MSIKEELAQYNKSLAELKKNNEVATDKGQVVGFLVFLAMWFYFTGSMLPHDSSIAGVIFSVGFYSLLLGIPAWFICKFIINFFIGFFGKADEDTIPRSAELQAYFNEQQEIAAKNAEKQKLAEREAERQRKAEHNRLMIEDADYREAYIAEEAEKSRLIEVARRNRLTSAHNAKVDHVISQIRSERTLPGTSASMIKIYEEELARLTAQKPY